jgi:hypothetical protein
MGGRGSRGLGKHDFDVPGFGGSTGWPDNDFHVAAKSSEAVEHLRLADTTKLPPKHVGQLWLGHSKDIGGLDLRQMPPLDDLPDLHGELRLDPHIGGFRQTQVGMDVATTRFDSSLFLAPFA